MRADADETDQLAVEAEQLAQISGGDLVADNMATLRNRLRQHGLARGTCHRAQRAALARTRDEIIHGDVGVVPERVCGNEESSARRAQHVQQRDEARVGVDVLAGVSSDRLRGRGSCRRFRFRRRRSDDRQTGQSEVACVDRPSTCFSEPSRWHRSTAARTSLDTHAALAEFGRCMQDMRSIVQHTTTCVADMPTGAFAVPSDGKPQALVL